MKSGHLPRVGLLHAHRVALWLVLIGLGWIATVRAEEPILTIAGATFPAPLYEKWATVYPQGGGARINYRAIGSSLGVEALLNHDALIGASDAPMTDQELLRQGDTILHLPTCIGAVTLVYHLPTHVDLKMTPEVIDLIFRGKIRHWSDPMLQEINPGLTLPTLEIAVVHRSDGSGTTAILTDYLCKVSPQWEELIGRGKSVRWPVGMGVRGNEGVAAMVKKVPGAIGYVELTHALQRNLPVAAIRNRAGHFAKPSLENIEAAAEVDLPGHMRMMLTDTDAPRGYPISAFTFLLVRRDHDGRRYSAATTQSLSDFLWWALHEGQVFTESLHYAPLPKRAVRGAETLLRRITHDEVPVVLERASTATVRVVQP